MKSELEPEDPGGSSPRVKRVDDPQHSYNGIRYAIFVGSQSGHCCFSATVVDTTKPTMIGDKHFHDCGQYFYDPVCECFDMADAEKVCNALNVLQKQSLNCN